MSTPYTVIPDSLAGAEFVLARFQLELQEPCRLDPDALLSLRRVLLQAGREVLGEQAAPLFDPPLTGDPYALKRFQKGAPAFVLRPDPLLAGDWQEGDRFDLEVLFLGAGITALGDFSRILRTLGQIGLVTGTGRFDLTAVTCLDSDGRWRRLSGMPGSRQPAPDLHPIGEWLDRRLPMPAPVLEILTPALLVTGGRALRQPRFGQLFPFLLRRVTSMLYYHCNLEVVDDPQPLLDAAAQIGTRWLNVQWQERGEAESPAAAGRPGGLTGRLLLEGEGVQELLWVVALATLFGIGKGAAYGSGRCHLVGVD